MSRFKINQKVVAVITFTGDCVNDPSYKPKAKPIKGNIYEVEGHYIDDGYIYLVLKELDSMDVFLQDKFAPLEPNANTKELAQTMVEHLGGEKKEEVERINI